MYKTLGISLIFISLGVFAYKIVQIKKIQLFNLKEFLKVLSIIKNELKFSMPEILVLCKKISERTSGEISSVFKGIEEILSKDSNVDFFTAWNMASCDAVLFSKEAADEISGFCQSFGKKTLDIEIENITRCQMALESMTEDEKKKYINEKKLICTLIASIGAVIVILGL